MARRFVMYTAVACVAIALACGKNSPAPTSPSTAQPTDGQAAADGSTLKVTAPVPTSPVNGAQPTALTLVANASTAKYGGSVSLTYQVQIRSGSTVTYDSGSTAITASGSTVTFTPPVALTPDGTYTWRMRAVSGSAVGPWSADATFKAPAGGYIRNGELYDPLTTGKTVGQIIGSTAFTSEGITLNDLTSTVRYTMDKTVSAGQFSFMAKNIKGSAPGGKTKMMSMQQGYDDITENAYRFTVEKRGSGYSDPGQTRYRIITGSSSPTGGQIFDGPAQTPAWDTTRWYFWQTTWSTGSARVTVRADSETGAIVYNVGISTGSKPYQPNPHVAYLGAPVGRAGSEDATVPRIIVKNVWLSANPRPAFPQ